MTGPLTAAAGEMLHYCSSLCLSLFVCLGLEEEIVTLSMCLYLQTSYFYTFMVNTHTTFFQNGNGTISVNQIRPKKVLNRNSVKYFSLPIITKIIPL